MGEGMAFIPPVIAFVKDIDLLFGYSK